MKSKSWSAGEVITRREVLGYWPTGQADKTSPWYNQAWLELPVHVVEDSQDQLITYIAEGAKFSFPPGRWPAQNGIHPWSNRGAWQGHGVLMIQRPGDHHAVWHFWAGPERRFNNWYINLQTAFRRTEVGYDTQDLELDLIVYPDGTWELKDDEVMEDRVVEGRFDTQLVQWARETADELIGLVENREYWWDKAWADWTPPSDWQQPV